MNIAYAGNRKVFKGMLLSLLSVIKHSSDALNVYVVTMDLKDMNEDYTPITSKDCSVLEAVVKSKNPESKVILLDATNIYTNSISQSKVINTTNPYDLIKLYLDEVDSIPDRLIYLDPATLLLQDLKQIDNINIEDFELAAAKAVVGSKGKNFFETGVLFLNMKLIKESGLFKRCRSFIATALKSVGDQEVLNKLAISVFKLDGAFNDQTKITQNTVIRNFVTPSGAIQIKGSTMKPWEVSKLHMAKINDFDDIIVQYEQINQRFGLDESIMPKVTAYNN